MFVGWDWDSLPWWFGCPFLCQLYVFHWICPLTIPFALNSTMRIHSMERIILTHSLTYWSRGRQILSNNNKRSLSILVNECNMNWHHVDEPSSSWCSPLRLRVCKESLSVKQLEFLTIRKGEEELHLLYWLSVHKYERRGRNSTANSTKRAFMQTRCNILESPSFVQCCQFWSSARVE